MSKTMRSKNASAFTVVWSPPSGSTASKPRSPPRCVQDDTVGKKSRRAMARSFRFCVNEKENARTNGEFTTARVASAATSCCGCSSAYGCQSRAPEYSSVVRMEIPAYGRVPSTNLSGLALRRGASAAVPELPSQPGLHLLELSPQPRSTRARWQVKPALNLRRILSRRQYGPELPRRGRHWPPKRGHVADGMGRSRERRL